MGQESGGIEGEGKRKSEKKGEGKDEGRSREEMNARSYI